MSENDVNETAVDSPVPCTIELLRTLFLFEKLTDEQLGWLCERGTLHQFPPGPVFTEGEPANCFYVLVEGEMVMSRRVGADDIELNRSSARGVYAGATQSYLDARVAQAYVNSVRVTVPTTFLVLSAADIATLMNEWFPMAVHLLEGLLIGMRNSQQAVGERERLLALGSLSAGLTHELNNPAAAAVRATSSLRDRVAGMRHKLALIASGKIDPEGLGALVDLQEQAAERVAKAPVLGPVETGDREDALAEWLDDHAVRRSWDIAPTFVQGGLDVEFLEHVAANAADGNLESAVAWLNYTVETELLMNEISDSTVRISTLVGAAKQYSQLDRAPFRDVDLHELLDSTLVMLGRKLGDVTVVKDYDRSLPDVPAYAAELNQVWTNLIDNAVAAMGGSGTLTVRTSRQDDRAVVEIADTGTGIPAEIRSRIFEPFFTTKPVGEGTGLGLDISWRIVVRKHHGQIDVDSEPGRTVFRVALPLSVPTGTTGQAEEGDRD